ncbi:MAG: hypothetical protein DRI48_09070, partial [Chloroflexi bacterium]
MADPLGKALAKHMDTALIHLRSYNRELIHITPEWCWRDFRLRLSRGRNHGSEEQLQRAALLWAMYRNFAQYRSERRRKYK